jgi:putative (di)nucleoside polyphosphate hydrolase
VSAATIAGPHAPEPSPTAHEGYRPCVGAALFNRDGLVFVGRRIGLPPGDPHAWQMPQGGIDAGETPLVAARRELAEETGVVSVALLGEAPVWLAYDLPDWVEGERWRNRWRGQTQRWFAFRHLGDDSAVNIAAPLGHKAEFSAWRWERLERTPDLIVPFKRPVYHEVAKLFAGFGKFP